MGFANAHVSKMKVDSDEIPVCESIIMLYVKCSASLQVWLQWLACSCTYFYFL